MTDRQVVESLRKVARQHTEKIYGPDAPEIIVRSIFTSMLLGVIVSADLAEGREPNLDEIYKNLERKDPI